MRVNRYSTFHIETLLLNHTPDCILYVCVCVFTKCFSKLDQKAMCLHVTRTSAQLENDFNKIIVSHENVSFNVEHIHWYTLLDQFDLFRMV